MIWFVAALGLVHAADINATTTDGQQVILHDDGTWEAASETSPAPAQEGEPKPCEALVSDNLDRMTGESHLGLIEPMIISDDGQTGLVVNLLVTGRSDSIIWVTSAVGASSCVDTDAKINVLFRDGTRQEVTSNTKFNCDGTLTTYLGRPFRGPALAELLASKEVETLRAWTRDGYVQRDLGTEQSLDLMTAFACLKN